MADAFLKNLNMNFEQKQINRTNKCTFRIDFLSIFFEIIAKVHLDHIALLYRMTHLFSIFFHLY